MIRLTFHGNLSRIICLFLFYCVRSYSRFGPILKSLKGILTELMNKYKKKEKNAEWPGGRPEVSKLEFYAGEATAHRALCSAFWL